MLRFGNHVITFDSEYPVVQTIKVRKEGKNVGEEVIAPIYFPRDLLGALRSVQRITTTHTAGTAKDIKHLIELLEKQQEELITVVEKHCKQKDK